MIPARIAAALALLAPAAAMADQLWGGLYQHDVRLSQDKYEGGQDLKVGWIGEPLEALAFIGRPAAHALVSVNLDGGTDYAAAGLNWTFGRRLYLRPGIGLSVNNGPRPVFRGNRRVDLGSPVTFEPELAAGIRLSDRTALEASWIHLSHATLFSRQNRGLDSIGLRLLVRLGD